MKLTIFFDGSFWCGLVEYVNERQEYRVIRYVFGPEPKDEIVFDFIFSKLPVLLEKNDQIQLASTVEPLEQKKLNPKRMQRLISRQKAQPALSTKAQQTLKEEQESKKAVHKKRLKIDKELAKKQKFEQKQLKKHQKQRGH